MVRHSNETPDKEIIILLTDMNRKLDALHEKTDKIEQKAITKGAIAGGVSGGIVAAGIAIIKSKFGL
ncbi:hypothetical protein [Ignatzschineria cameli]|uniref:Uncharacterized protein n=1 Tax=Ignatzschineria cameli TaxID=2182793 RepID=A0A2U2AQW5_9GAMM|nr:hypothetical protein [Ignatzschineria cameli]PWD86204.1 hypothetical protein DC077_05545 [Ignatzschineria cameli]PWD88651.1 hypothetical protein DC079_08910 [Ignatzschineria cameli]PWD89545.1 hypothetical protein DC081_08830 [Ignatzschineria cameli]PWD90170.1 hypothetical protein DC078_08765 [Ignatzschineria cameli]